MEFAIVVGVFFGFVIQCVWLILGFRAVKAHKKLAEATRKQSDALNNYLRKEKKKMSSKKKADEILN